MKYLSCLAVCTVLLAAHAVAQTTDQNGADPAGWVPGDALAYIGIADVAKLSDELQHTAFYTASQDPELKECCGQISPVLKLYDDARNRLARALGTEPSQLKSPFSGPIAIYVPTPADPARDDLQIVFVAGIGDRELAETYYERAVEKLREKAGEHQQIPFESCTIDHFTRENRSSDIRKESHDDSGDEFDLGEFDNVSDSFPTALKNLLARNFSGDAMPEELALCLTARRLVVAPTPEHVKQVLSSAQAGDSLLVSDAYQTLLREFQPLGSVRLLINLAGLFELMKAVDGDEARDALTMLGADSVRSLIGHVHFDGKQFESKTEALLLVSGQRTGLTKIFSMKNRDITPAAAVSADSIVYSCINADACELLDELERMIRQEDATAADELHARLESIPLPDGTTLNLRDGLLENLCEPLTLAVSFQPPYGPQSTRIQLTIGQRDRQAIRSFLEKLSVLAAGMMVEREEDGTFVYDIPVLGLSVAPGDHVIIAGTTNAVDAALASPAAEHSLAADARFKRAAALAPREASAVFYIDSRRAFEAALEMARHEDALTSAPAGGPADLVARQLVAEFAEGIDPDRIEAARRLSRHLAPRIITLATTPNGIRLTQIQLAPDSN